MVSTFTTRKRFEKQNPGENSNTWGGYLNSNTIDMIDEAFGLVCVAMTTAGDSTLSTADGATDAGRRSQLVITGAPTSNVSLFVPAVQSFYLVRNKMTGSNKVTLKNAGGTVGVDFSGSGSGAEQGLVISDGTNVREIFRTTSVGAIAGFTSVVWTAVSNAPTDTTGGASGDFIPFLDISEGNALNKVTTQKLFDNALAGMTAKTTVGASDQFLMLDVDTSTAKFVTATNSYKSINTLTEDTQLDPTNDYVATYDASAAAGKKVKVQTLNSMGNSSKTGNYTVLDSDRGTSIRFSGLSADATLTLPAASGRAGFILHVSNEDTNDTTGYGVIFDPNSSELIDGLSTRKGYTGTRVTILCDGTGWRTVSGNYRYFSGDLSFSLSANVSVSHYLGVRPKVVDVEFKCNTADLNWSVGDIVKMADTEGGSGSAGYVFTYDATAVVFKAGSNIYTLNKTTFVGNNIDVADWRVRVWASD